MKNEQVYSLTEKEIAILEAVLFRIESELDRVYWNIHHKEMESPFLNTGQTYSNDVFSVKAYDWSDEGNQEPNFVCHGLRVWWYKHLGRGTVATTDSPFTLEYIEDILSDCIESLCRQEDKYDF